MTHDLFRLYSEEDYCKCDFSEATELVGNTAEGTYTYACSEPGTSFFACNVEGACRQGMQRVRVMTLPDPNAETTTCSGDHCYGQILQNHIIPVAYDGVLAATEAGDSDTSDGLTEERANTIVALLEDAIPEAPGSCSDWLPAHYNVGDRCLVWLKTELGFIERVRPIPRLSESQEWYEEALESDSDHCGALSYAAELHLTKGDQATADSYFRRACASCHWSLDVLAITQAYRKHDLHQFSRCGAQIEALMQTGNGGLGAHPSGFILIFMFSIIIIMSPVSP